MRRCAALAGALLAVLWLGLPTRLCAAKAGCPGKTEAQETYMQRAQEARAAGNLGRAAEAYWGAWCASDQFGHLVNICKLHSLARECALGKEILDYAERRQTSATREQRDQLRQCREDITRLRCAGAPPPRPPPTTSIEPQTLMVTVKTTPPGASIFIDGELRGQSDTSLFLPPGTYPLRLDLLGHRSVNQVITVSKDAERSFAYALPAEPPSIEVAPRGADRSADGADVYLDDAFKGRVPLTLETTEGPHRLELRKAGFRTASESIHVKHADHLRIFSVLEVVQQTGQLLVSAEAGAEVYVDGHPHGLVPAHVKDLTPGEHDVEVHRSGAPHWTRKIKIDAGQELRLPVPQLPPPPPVEQQPSGHPIPQVPQLPPPPPVEQQPSGHPIPPVQQSGTVPQVPQPSGHPIPQVPQPGTVPQPGLAPSGPRPRPPAMGRLVFLNVRRLVGVHYFVDSQEIPEEKALDGEGLSLPYGRHVILLRKDGYDDLVKEVTIKAQHPEKVFVTPNHTGR